MHRISHDNGLSITQFDWVTTLLLLLFISFDWLISYVLSSIPIKHVGAKAAPHDIKTIFKMCNAKGCFTKRAHVDLKWERERMKKKKVFLFPKGESNEKGV